MTRVALPAGYRASQLQRVLQSILNYDQLDDWIPDPIYYRDVAAAQARFLESVQATINSGAVACETPLLLDIHAESKKKFQACTAPLVVRVLLADAVASQAEKMQKGLVGDYVFGYKYQSAAQAYGKKWFVDVFGDGFHQKGVDPPCNNGPHDQEPTLPKDWNTSYYVPGPPCVFTSGGDGLHECLTSVSQFLVATDAPLRSVLWCDVERFYPTVDRAQLRQTLEQSGADVQVVAFVDAVLNAVGGAGATGLVSVDDTVAFLGNFFLKPVDEVLAKAKLVWRRYGDEYFLLTQGRTAEQRVRNAAKLLSEAATQRGLRLDLAGAKTMNVNYFKLDHLESLADNCTVAWGVLETDGFLLYVLVQGSNKSDLEQGRGDYTSAVSPGAWENSLKAILDVPVGTARLNRTFHMLRTMNLARKDDVLWLRGHGKPSVRGERYRAALARQSWLPRSLAARLNEAFAKDLIWHQLWLLRLAADVGPGAAGIAPNVRSAMDAKPLVVRAQAALTYARIASDADLRSAVARLQPSGDWLADRMLAAAACLAGMRLKQDLVTSRFGKMDPAFLSYLASVAKGA
jgi:hypothetical protein